MKKIFLTIIFIILFLFSSLEVWAVCKHEAKIKKCRSALESFFWKKITNNLTVWSSLKDFSDFPCLQSWDEARAFQIAMDENFKKIDKDIDKFLKNLYESKSFYVSSENSYFEWIEQIYAQTDTFKKRYYQACSESFKETAECTTDWWKKAVSILWAIDFISWANWWWSCYKLADAKTNIFLEIAYNWLLLNYSQVEKDKLKDYTQTEREAHSRLSEAMRVNQWYIERLNSKWTSKTKHTLNSK